MRSGTDGPGGPMGGASKKYRSEVGNLERAMELTGLNEGTLVTLREEDGVAVKSGTVHVVPAWRWFLDRTA